MIENYLSEAEICQLADIQDSIQRMREGEVCQSQTEKQSVEARLSSSCPSLVVDSGEEGGGVVDTPDGVRRPRGRAQNQHFKDQRDYRKRAGRQRSPSVSTGDSEEEAVEAVRGGRAGGGGGGAGNHAGLEAGSGLQALHKSISTPSMVDNDVVGAANGNHHGKTS